MLHLFLWTIPIIERSIEINNTTTWEEIIYFLLGKEKNIEKKGVIA